MKVLQNNQPSKHKVTLVGCVHGSESYGRVVFEHFAARLSEYPGLTLILANEEALAKRTRYIDADLNRSFPGDADGNLEERLAHELLRTIDPGSYIIDIHTTRGQLPMVSIVTNVTSRTRKILNQLPPTKIVYMKGGFGSLISQFRASVSLEYPDSLARGVENTAQLEQIVTNLLSGVKKPACTHAMYITEGKIPLEMPVPVSATSFQQIEGTTVIPFLPRRVAFRGSKGFCLSKPRDFIA